MAASEIARKHGMIGTSCPSRSRNRTGSGAHFHISIGNAQARRTCSTTRRTRRACSCRRWRYHFLGGLLKHARALAAICAPTVNSYKRLVVGRALSGATWAPAYIAYGDNNRTGCVRIPGGRLEMRLPDAGCNPYLATAAIIAAGMDGVEAQARSGRAEQHQPLRAARRAQLKRAGHRPAAAEPARGVDALEAGRSGARRAWARSSPPSSSRSSGWNGPSTRAMSPTGRPAATWSSSDVRHRRTAAEEARPATSGWASCMVPMLDRHDRARPGLGRAGGVRRASAGARCKLQPVPAARRARLERRSLRGCDAALPRRACAAATAASHAVLDHGAPTPTRCEHWLTAALRRRSCCCRRAAASSSTRTSARRPRSPSAIDFDELTGTHVVGHTRMATESAVTPAARIRSPPARISAWCTTARCRTRTWCAASSSRWASASRPTTTPRPPAASSSGACARATTLDAAMRAGLRGARWLLHLPDRHATTSWRWCAMRSPASRRSWPRPTTTWPSPPSSARWPICPACAREAVRAAARRGLLMEARMNARRDFDLATRQPLRELNQSCIAMRRRRRRAQVRRAAIRTARTASPWAWTRRSTSTCCGHAGYYVGRHEQAGQRHRARQCRPGVAENMMSRRGARRRASPRTAPAPRRTAACW